MIVLIYYIVSPIGTDQEDFIAESKDVIFPANDTMVCTTFVIVNNRRVEDNERFEVTFTISDSRVSGPQQNPTVTIEDDDSKCFVWKLY